MYDYLVVGSGLFGAVFAHEARKNGKSVLMLEAAKVVPIDKLSVVITLVAIYIVRSLMGLTYTNMALIFFIHLIKMCGNM